MSEALEFRASEGTGALTKALIAAAKAFGPVVKDRVVDMGQGKAKYAYATLIDFLEATRPALCDNGLAVLQMPAQRGERTTLVTRLMHESGEWIEAAFALPPTPSPGPQGMGSAISYARRYAYTALLGIAADDDDDGHAANGGKPEITKKPPAKSPAPKAEPASRWQVVSSTDGTVKDCGTREEWEKEWRLRIGAVEKSTKMSPDLKRRKLEDMLRVNGDAFTALRNAFEAAAVSNVTAYAAKADSRLSEIEQ